MKLVSELKPIVLDSSTWNNGVSTGTLNKIVNDLYIDGYIPIYTMHNLMEMINYENDIIRKKRINQITCIEYLYNFNDLVTPSSVISLRTHEFRYFMQNSNHEVDYDDMREYIRGKLHLTSGKEILRNLDQHSDLLFEKTKKNSEGLFFASVPTELHHPDYDYSKLRLSDIKLNFEDDKSFRKHIDLIKDNLTQKGDKKHLDKIEDVSEMLVENYEEAKKHFSEDKQHFFAEYAGLGKDEITLDMTLEEYFITSERNTQLRIIAKELKVDFRVLLQYNLDNIPTFMFDDKFHREYNSQIIRDKPRRSEMSIFEDRYLSYFSIYFEVIVDKRTGEVLKKIKGKLPFGIKYHVNKIGNK